MSTTSVLPVYRQNKNEVDHLALSIRILDY